MKKTKTSSFGVGKRESHDSSAFYRRVLYQDTAAESLADYSPASSTASSPVSPAASSLVPLPPLSEWADKIYRQSSEKMKDVPDNCVGLAFTSPPYNVGKEYDKDMGLEAYLELVQRVGKEVYRALCPGGRYVVNIANLGRKPYIPLHAHFYGIHGEIGFLPMGEIIWRKARGANGSCAWGSWKNAKSPRLRDVHEYLLVFAKQWYHRPDSGTSDIGRDEFLNSTLSVWEIPTVSAKRVGHPAPFPVELAERVIRLYSYKGDVVLDPFVGSGSTCVAAVKNGRHYVGYDTSKDYCALSRRRIGAARRVLISRSDIGGQDK